jgi:hypothetical protein
MRKQLFHLRRTCQLVIRSVCCLAHVAVLYNYNLPNLSTPYSLSLVVVSPRKLWQWESSCVRMKVSWLLPIWSKVSAPGSYVFARRTSIVWPSRIFGAHSNRNGSWQRVTVSKPSYKIVNAPRSGWSVHLPRVATKSSHNSSDSSVEMNMSSLPVFQYRYGAVIEKKRKSAPSYAQYGNMKREGDGGKRRWSKLTRYNPTCGISRYKTRIITVNI